MKHAEYHTIAGHLAASIENREYQPLERLPSERDLAERFGVSRNTVREAIRTLAEKDLVQVRPGSGTFVAGDAGQRLASAVEGRTGRRLPRLREVLELRKILEPGIAALAAERMEPGLMSTLEEILAQQKRAAEAGRDTAERDELLHRCLVRATGNSVLMNVYETLNHILAESRAREFQTRERVSLSTATHKELISALKSGEPGAAARVMARHMAEIETSLLGPEPDGRREKKSGSRNSG